MRSLPWTIQWNIECPLQLCRSSSSFANNIHWLKVSLHIFQATERSKLRLSCKPIYSVNAQDCNWQTFPTGPKPNSWLSSSWKIFRLFCWLVGQYVMHAIVGKHACLKDLKRCGHVMGWSAYKVGVIVLVVKLICGISEGCGMECCLFQHLADLYHRICLCSSLNIHFVTWQQSCSAAISWLYVQDTVSAKMQQKSACRSRTLEFKIWNKRQFLQN